jgi:hypothetical protein
LKRYATSLKVVGSIADEVDISIYLILPAAVCPWADSVSKRNDYQESSWGLRAADA